MVSKSNAPITSIAQVYTYLKKKPHKLSSVVLIFSRPIFVSLQRHFSSGKIIGLLHGEALIPAADRSEVGLILCEGYGPSSVAMLVEELVHLGVKQIISMGFAGALVEDLKPGSVHGVSFALAEESVSRDYSIFEECVSPRRLQVHLPIVQVLGELGVWTTGNPYQETPEKIEWALAKGCGAVEMEASVLFSLAHFYSFECASFVCISDSLVGGVWNLNWKDSAVKGSLERAILSALHALLLSP